MDCNFFKFDVGIKQLTKYILQLDITNTPQDNKKGKLIKTKTGITAHDSRICVNNL